MVPVIAAADIPGAVHAESHRSLGSGRSITAGVTGGYRQTLTIHNTFNVTDNADSSVVADKTRASTTQAIPAHLGAGISFASDKFTAGVDYSFYKYSSLDTGSDIIKYKDRNRLTAGITYVPSRYDVRRYWKRIKFQMGAYVDDSYLTASGSRGLKFDRYTFPVSNRNTISESSLGLTFGVTFGESWFVRKRLE